MPDMKFVLNGEPMTTTYEEGMTFLEVLRDVCGITSPKDGCAPQGYCGCCTVLIDGRAALSCLRKPETVAEKAVTTLEGVSAETRDLLAKAFVREGGGFLSMADMASFHVGHEPSCVGDFHEYRIFTNGPWCQGPVLTETLQILAEDDLSALGHNSVVITSIW